MPGTSIARRDALLAILGIATLPLLSGGAFAAQSSSDDSSAASVQAFAASLLRVMKAGEGTPFAQRYASLQPAVDRTFDLDTILRVSVGPKWSAMTAEQQAALAGSFRRYTVANFVANFDTYAGETIEVSPDIRALANGDQVVTTRMTSPSGSNVVLSYVMRPAQDGWKAVDVLADGSISRVATQRSDFRNLLSNGGGAALVSSLNSKVAALSGGGLA